MKYQAFAHVWTVDYCYWNPVGGPQDTYADAIAETYAAADKFWPGDSNPSRRASFLGRCRITGPDRPKLPSARGFF